MPYRISLLIQPLWRVTPNQIRMKKIMALLLLSIVGFISCKNPEKEIDKLKTAKQYYRALDQSSSSEMRVLLTDSLVTTIPEYEYEATFSRNDYIEKFLKWDSIFEPTYKVLEMESKNGVVKAKVSKTDKRILFLMQRPFLTSEILRFKKDKIVAVETEYLNFDEITWEENRNALLSWTEENHPELNDFIYDQTESGGRKFLKAIELYESKK